MTHGHLCSMAILRGEAIASDPHVGGNWRHDDAKRPKVQLSKRSERKTQSTRSKSPFLSFPSLFPSSSSFSRRQKLQASVFLSLSDCEEGFEWNGRDYPDLLFPFSRHDIPLDRRGAAPGKKRVGMDTESENKENEKERSVAFKQTVYPSVKISGNRIVSL